ncbi:MAG: hypothetical protein KA763_12765 [Xanthomonadales bacterium]|nr:hypothetical protein [Xanthomonadales bacterium]
MMNFRATLQQIANTAPVSLVAASVAKLVALVLVLVLITPSPERDECLT